ncbi:unnamed protein product [Protopolystoma xenopodis]|uniref:Uncharacterized protein n=1 Tax=Protopolystoma xenopodis TaxID=117903 RepID=A0A448WGX9_9PLAT|nr:unnamed protein product [Protopolystoma xenopodis]
MALQASKRQASRRRALFGMCPYGAAPTETSMQTRVSCHLAVCRQLVQHRTRKFYCILSNSKIGFNFWRSR